MKFKCCGEVAALMTLGVEQINGRLDIEVDADGEAVVTRDDGMQYVTSSSGGFTIPSSFLRDGRYTFRVGGVRSTSFIVCGNTVERYTEAYGEEIANMWVAIGGISEAVDRAVSAAQQARDDVELFRDGYRTE